VDGIRQHTSAYVSIRQHTSAYVSIRQPTSAYVSIRQHIICVDYNGLQVRFEGGIVLPPQVSAFVLLHQLLRQYLHFCTSKASKLSTCAASRHFRPASCIIVSAAVCCCNKAAPILTNVRRAAVISRSCSFVDLPPYVCGRSSSRAVCL
jgi:hypothetical protein